MIKLIYCLRRLPGLTLAEFQDHWINHHAGISSGDRPMRRYIQYHRLADDPTADVLPQAGASTVEPFDGAAIAWWDDAESMRWDMQHGGGVPEAMEDEKLFIDHARSPACLTEEHVIVEPTGAVPYVLFECLHRQTSVDRAAFQAGCSAQAEQARATSERGLLRGYIQNHTLLEGDQRGLLVGIGGESWDTIVTSYYETVPKLKAAAASWAAGNPADEAQQLVDYTNSTCFLARRHVIRDYLR